MSYQRAFRRHLALSLATSIAVALLAAPVGALAAPPPPAKERAFAAPPARTRAFAVTAASASVSPPSYSGLCPTTFTFTGTITTNGPGTVTYGWGHVPYVFGNKTLTFARAGTQTVTYTLTMDREWPPNEGHWVDLLIQSPNFVNAGHVAFELQCSNRQKSPRPVSVTLKDGSPAVIIGDCLWLVKPNRQVPAPDGTYELNTGETLVVKDYKIVRRFREKLPIDPGRPRR